MDDQISAAAHPVTAGSAAHPARTILFGLFFASGFCGLVYQIVWLRMAFAHFGVITPVLSIVVSVFMLGLGVGSVLAGRWAERWSRGAGISPAYVYAAAELLIGLGAVVVPVLFELGQAALLGAGDSSSSRYLALSAAVIALSILPWCVAMGATYPLMMAFLRRTGPEDERTFSFLYLANVVGAMVGTVLAALVLVEMFGFRATSLIAACINLGIALVSVGLARAYPMLPASAIVDAATPRLAPLARGEAVWVQVMLFTTGFASLAMEVVWTRAFTLVLKTTIYAFAAVLAVYLLSTWIGSYLYRRSLREGWSISTERLLGLLAIAALVPVALNDPRINDNVILTLESIVPFCLGLGYLTPRLIDEYARGDANRAGWAYSINIAGGILGPLCAAYLLLPSIGVRWALLVLALPMLALFGWATRAAAVGLARRLEIVLPFAGLFVFAAVAVRGYEDGVLSTGDYRVYRDHAASAVAYGKGMRKVLLVNGIGITHLTPITKVMAHLPLAAHGRAQSGLVICFGMGTTFRSMATWDIDSTVVDLTGSVFQAFPYFFDNAAQVVASPKVRAVVDDGRRFLMRTAQKYDVIVIDPPPPVEAAGSSLLYSREFYELIKARLAPGGILQQWLPRAEDQTLHAVARSLRDAFPYVQVYRALEEGSGHHFLASMTPLPTLSPGELLARLPARARADLMEWNPDMSPERMAEEILRREMQLAALTPPSRENPTITDDRPFNEYFLLRRRGLLER